nr:hypothetical protein BaRGS_031680 [Batillaria attramentaria]
MMGIIRLPQRNDYWRIGEDCWLAHTNFNKAMSRNRFNDIWRYLHTQDNMAPAGPTYSVDETMVKYKGRLMFRQYMPMKPTKWGIKKANPDAAPASFQHFVEAVAHRLVTTVTTRKAPLPAAVPQATLSHKIEKIFQTRKVCKECARQAGNGVRHPTTKYGCVICQTACHPQCVADHIRHHIVVVQNPQNGQ